MLTPTVTYAVETNTTPEQFMVVSLWFMVVDGAKLRVILATAEFGAF